MLNYSSIFLGGVPGVPGLSIILLQIVEDLSPCEDWGREGGAAPLHMGLPVCGNTGSNYSRILINDRL